MATLLIVLMGGKLIWNERQRWEHTWLRPQVWAWLGMSAVVAVCVFVVIPTQRPRSAYLLSITLVLLCIVGHCTLALVERLPVVRRFSPLVPWAMLVSPLFTWNYYGSHVHHYQHELYSEYQRLRPYQDLLARSGTVAICRYPMPMQNYAGLGHPVDSWYGYDQLGQRQPGQVKGFLDEHRVTAIEVPTPEALRNELNWNQLEAMLLRSGWHKVDIVLLCR